MKKKSYSHHTFKGKPIERQTMTLIFEKCSEGDYYKSRYHMDIYFIDPSTHKKYVYSNPYDTKFDIFHNETNPVTCTINGYFLPADEFPDLYQYIIWSPRLSKVEKME